MDDEQSLLDEAEPPETAADAFARLEARISAMDGRLALMARAVEHIALERQAIEAPDYSQTLGEILNHIAGIRRASEEGARSPLWQLTPESIADQIEDAAVHIRKQDAETIRAAKAGLERAVTDMDRHRLHHRYAVEQRRFVVRAVAVTAIATGLIVSALPGMIARALPDSWELPEQMARRTLDEPTLWRAGIHLMQAGDPEGWQIIAKAVELRQENEERIAVCEKAATKAGRPVQCVIEMKL